VTAPYSVAVVSVADHDVADWSLNDPGFGGAFHPYSSGLWMGDASHADAAALHLVKRREHWRCAPWTDRHGDPSLVPCGPHQPGGACNKKP